MKKAITALLALAALAVVAFFFFRSSPRTSPATPSPKHDRPVSPNPIQSPASAPSPLISASVSESDRRLLGILDQIFASKNDNDPRLDTEFKNLSAATKQVLMQKYQTLPMEARNERGTIVFLIGRELNRPEDFAFLAQVGGEPPCLSLSNCKKEGSRSEEDLHEETAISVTLAYPQHVAAKSLENLLSQAEQGDVDPARVSEALNALNQMTESPVPSIARQAADLRRRYSHLRSSP